MDTWHAIIGTRGLHIPLRQKYPLTISVELYGKNQISNKFPAGANYFFNQKKYIYPTCIALNPVLKKNKTNFFYDTVVTKAVAEKSMAIISFKFKHPLSSLRVSV